MDLEINLKNNLNMDVIYNYRNNFNKIIIKYIFISSIIYLICGYIVAEKLNQRTIIYKETINNVSVETSVKETISNEEILIEIVNKNKLFSIRHHKKNFTLKTIYLVTDSSTSITAVREGKSILMYGFMDGKNVEKSFKVSNEPWYGSPFLFKDFILSSKREKLLYLIDPETQSIEKFKIIKLNQEKITINKKEYEAIKLRLTLNDIRSVLWNSFYWFSVDDGLLLKSDELRGPINTPRIQLEFQRFSE